MLEKFRIIIIIIRENNIIVIVLPLYIHKYIKSKLEANLLINICFMIE